MILWKLLSGMVELKLESADIASTINSAVELGITIYFFEQINELSAVFTVNHTDYKALSILCKKRGDTLDIIAKKGVYWRTKVILSRPVLMAGFAFLLFSVFLLPTRILFIRTEGNIKIPDRQIIAAGEYSGIHFGASRRTVRSEKVKNALLSALPELKWAGVNTQGCVAIISVKERTDNEPQKEMYFNNVIAERDGIITSCTITEGNSLCSIGQAVKEGQILVSGYTDCGLSIRVTRAEAEIFAQTDRNISVIASTDYLKKEKLITREKKYSLLLGKKRINLWKDSGIYDVSCDRMYKEYYVTLPGGYQLPVGLAVETTMTYQYQESDFDSDMMKDSIVKYSRSYLHQQMISGEILSSAESFEESDSLICLIGKYVCTEMISRVQQE